VSAFASKNAAGLSIALPTLSPVDRRCAVRSMSRLARDSSSRVVRVAAVIVTSAIRVPPRVNSCRIICLIIISLAIIPSFVCSRPEILRYRYLLLGSELINLYLIQCLEIFHGGFKACVIYFGFRMSNGRRSSRIFPPTRRASGARTTGGSSAASFTYSSRAAGGGTVRRNTALRRRSTTAITAGRNAATGNICSRP